MGWVLRLVETETDRPGRGVDVMEISRSGDLGDMAKLGLTLPEARASGARAGSGGRRANATIMRLCGRTARPAAVRVTSRIGGFIRSQRCSARCRCGWRGFAALAVATPRRGQLALALSVDTGAGPAASASFRIYALSRRRWRAGASFARGGRDEFPDLARPYAQNRPATPRRPPRSGRRPQRRRSPSP